MLFFFFFVKYSDSSATIDNACFENQHPQRRFSSIIIFASVLVVKAFHVTYGQKLKFLSTSVR